MSAANGRASRRQPRPPDGAEAEALLHAGKTARFTLPTDYAAARNLQERVLAAMQDKGYSCDSVFAMRLGMEEALINAIKHGNRMDPAKKVHVEATVESKQTRISVEDEGQGFSRSTVPDPTAPENLTKQHGRGILLMESYMDRIRYDRGGRRVTLIKSNRNSTRT